MGDLRIEGHTLLEIVTLLGNVMKMFFYIKSGIIWNIKLVKQSSRSFKVDLDKYNGKPFAQKEDETCKVGLQRTEVSSVFADLTKAFRACPTWA